MVFVRVIRTPIFLLHSAFNWEGYVAVFEVIGPYDLGTAAGRTDGGYLLFGRYIVASLYAQWLMCLDVLESFYFADSID